MRDSNISLKESVADLCTVPIKSMTLDLGNQNNHVKGPNFGKRSHRNVPRVKHLEIMLQISEHVQHTPLESFMKASTTMIGPSKSETNSPKKKGSLKSKTIEKIKILIRIEKKIY